MADFADCNIGFDAGEYARQYVLCSARCIFKLHERSLGCFSVAPCAKCADTLNLRLLDCGINTKKRHGRLFVNLKTI